MNTWEPWQWQLLTAFNYATGISYLIIPFKLWLVSYEFRRAGLGNAELSYRDTWLFIAFITSCGAHHFVHPTFMPTGRFWPIIWTDFVMVFFSFITAMRGVVIVWGMKKAADVIRRKRNN